MEPGEAKTTDTSLPRVAIGIAFDSRFTRVDAALLSATGTGHAIDPQVLHSLRLPLDSVSSHSFAELRSARQRSTPDFLDAIAALREEAALATAEAIRTLLQSANVPTDQVLLAGLLEPGLWQTGARERPFRISLCDAAKVAELTGLCVIDGFPDRDLAEGGQGGPVDAIAHWTFLAKPQDHRFLLDLGRTTRLMLLPAADQQRAGLGTLAFDVGPGTAMLDCFAEKLAGAEEEYDQGGREAVQGRCLQPLVQRWMNDGCFQEQTPRWHPYGIDARPFVEAAINMALEQDWTIRDLLCTANHFLAAQVARAVARSCHDRFRPREILVAGGGRANGFLMSRLREALDCWVVPIEAHDLDDASLAGGAAAVLALFHLDQVPATTTTLSGVGSPKVLGRLTPGRPAAWRKLLEEETHLDLAVRPLRSAM